MHSVCKEKIENLNLLADGMLDSKKAAVLNEHILTCPACKSYYKDIVSMKETMASMKLDAPADIDALISNAVRNSSKKMIIRRNIYRYSTVAAACLVVIVFLFSRGLFNLGADKSMEIAELQDRDNSVTDGLRGDDSYALTAENNSGGEEAAEKSVDTPTEAIVPQPEVDMESAIYGNLAGYRYNSSAVENTDTIVVNPDGIPLDSGYGGKQDVFYASGAYTIDEMISIIAKEFNPENIWGEDDSIFFYFSVSNLPKLESRLGLVAADLITDKTEQVSIRIISIKDKDE